MRIISPLIVGLLVTASSAARAGSYEFAYIDNKVMRAYDLQSISKTGPTASVWMLEARSVIVDDIAFSMTHLRVDCDDQTAIFDKFAIYNDQGALVGETEGRKPPSMIVPDTVVARISKDICKGPRSLDRPNETPLDVARSFRQNASGFGPSATRR